MALTHVLLSVLAILGSVSAAPAGNNNGNNQGNNGQGNGNNGNGKGHGNGNVAASWANQWQPDSNGVVHYGYNSSYGQGFNNATQIRVAYRGCDAMSVSYSTNSRQDKPTIKYGTSNTSLTNSVSSDVSITYETSPKWENHVVLEGLQGNTVYYYQIQDGPVKSFKTARCAGDNSPYTVAVFADMGVMGPTGLSDHLPSGIKNALKPGEQNTVQQLIAQRDSYEFAVHVGDLAYADYWAKEIITGGSNLTIQDQILGYNNLNEAFFDEISPISQEKPYMVAVGNHEANCINGAYKDYTEAICVAGLTNFTEYKARWNMPGDGSASNNFWYSFDVGMTHYLVFDTETDLPAPYHGAVIEGGTEGFHEGNVGASATAQVDFIKQDLAKVDRTKTPWVVAMGHRPWYVPADGDQFADGLAVFEPLFTEGKVDLVFHGHVHLLSRSYPVWKNGTVQQQGYTEPQAPVYIVNGAGGHYDGLDPATTPYPSYVAFANDTSYSYSTLTFHNSTHMTHQFRASADNHVIDEVTIQKTH